MRAHERPQHEAHSKPTSKAKTVIACTQPVQESVSTDSLQGELMHSSYRLSISWHVVRALSNPGHWGVFSNGLTAKRYAVTQSRPSSANPIAVHSPS